MPIHFLHEKNVAGFRRGMHVKVHNTSVQKEKIMERAIDIQLRHHKRLKDQHELKSLRAEKMLLNTIVSAQRKSINYRHEFERLRNTLSENAFRIVKNQGQYSDRRAEWNEWLKEFPYPTTASAP